MPKPKQKAKTGLPYQDRPYRKGVGAVIFNTDGLVFAGRRLDAPDAWQLPQGGIDDGEKSKAAVLREVAEETGIVDVEVIAKSKRWLAYDLPSEIADRVWKGRFRGQEQKWFALRFLGCDKDIDLNASGHPEFDAWEWVELERLPELIVPFKRPLYEAIVQEFLDLPAQLRANE
ncbi:MAG: RNA pyrophosphohydrolase [Magnetovibrionaceae bacterium]